MNCDCHKCIKDYGLTGEKLLGSDLPLSMCKMILCPMCGNKRCPKASDHRNECTNSNEPNQEGSIY